jgi:hypothetical protein
MKLNAVLRKKISISVDTGASFVFVMELCCVLSDVRTALLGIFR